MLNLSSKLESEFRSDQKIMIKLVEMDEKLILSKQMEENVGNNIFLSILVLYVNEFFFYEGIMMVS
jgi:hypothetical protein